MTLLTLTLLNIVGSYANAPTKKRTDRQTNVPTNVLIEQKTKQTTNQKDAATDELTDRPTNQPSDRPSIKQSTNRQYATNRMTDWSTKLTKQPYNPQNNQSTDRMIERQIIFMPYLYHILSWTRVLSDNSSEISQVKTRPGQTIHQIQKKGVLASTSKKNSSVSVVRYWANFRWH